MSKATKRKAALLAALGVLAHGDGDISHVGFDIEERHQDADELLLGYIDDEEIRAAFEDVPKWYA